MAGTDKSVAWTDVTLAAYVPHNYPLDQIEPGLEETAFYDPANFTFPAGAYVCEVEVDADTGKVVVVGFTCADDFGNVINPMIVEGQVHGGVAQGIGQALLENAVYDDNGQLQTGSYMDYAMPRADDLPSFVVDASCVTPCTHNPLGREGLRRGRRHRLAAGAGQRGDRRAAVGRPRRRRISTCRCRPPGSGRRSQAAAITNHALLAAAPRPERRETDSGPIEEGRQPCMHSTSSSPRPSPTPSRRWPPRTPRRSAAARP